MKNKISPEEIIKTAQKIEEEQGEEASLLWLLTVPGGHTEEEAKRRIAGLKAACTKGDKK